MAAAASAVTTHACHSAHPLVYALQLSKSPSGTIIGTEHEVPRDEHGPAQRPGWTDDRRIARRARRLILRKLRWGSGYR